MNTGALLEFELISDYYDCGIGEVFTELATCIANSKICFDELREIQFKCDDIDIISKFHNWREQNLKILQEFTSLKDKVHPRIMSRAVNVSFAGLHK